MAAVRLREQLKEIGRAFATRLSKSGCSIATGIRGLTARYFLAMLRMRCQAKYERDAREQGFHRIAGIDEVGRGALFGPVFAAAVILSPDRPIRGLRDSKQLDPERREVLSVRIRERAVAWALAAADAFEIDRVNIYQASRLAMRRAIERLNPQPDYLLVDAITIDLPLPQRALIHGDALSQCIAAASILAKVERDACMREWDRVFPQYGLKNHKGYSTDQHWKALEACGPTSLHRFSFWPVREHSAHVLWSGYPRQEQLFPLDAVNQDALVDEDALADEIPPEWSEADDSSPQPAKRQAAGNR